jgi:hypothetical protein
MAGNIIAQPNKKFPSPDHRFPSHGQVLNVFLVIWVTVLVLSSIVILKLYAIQMEMEHASNIRINYLPPIALFENKNTPTRVFL